MLSNEQNMHAIRAIKKTISNKDSFMGTADIEVKKGNATILTCNDVDIQTSYEISYMQFRVSIMWENRGIDFRHFGLRGSYNTNFNEMDAENGCLVIHADDLDIIITKN